MKNAGAGAARDAQVWNRPTRDCGSATDPREPREAAAARAAVRSPKPRGRSLTRGLSTIPAIEVLAQAIDLLDASDRQVGACRGAEPYLLILDPLRQKDESSWWPKREKCPTDKFACAYECAYGLAPLVAFRLHSLRA